MRYFGLACIVLGSLMALYTLLQFLGVAPGPKELKWQGPVLLAAGAGIILRSKRGHT